MTRFAKVYDLELKGMASNSSELQALQSMSKIIIRYEWGRDC